MIQMIHIIIVSFFIEQKIIVNYGKKIKIINLLKIKHWILL